MILHISTSEKGFVGVWKLFCTENAINRRRIKNSNALVRSLLCEKQNAWFIKVSIFIEQLITHSAKCYEQNKEEGVDKQ